MEADDEWNQDLGGGVRVSQEVKRNMRKGRGEGSDSKDGVRKRKARLVMKKRKMKTWQDQDVRQMSDAEKKWEV